MLNMISQRHNSDETVTRGSRGRGSQSGGDARKRHKYAVLIGSVLVVYTVYLINYAVVQLLHLASVSQSVKHRMNK